MSETTFLELIEGVGVETDFIRNASGIDVPNPKAGEPAPLNHIGITIPVPTAVEGGDVVLTTRGVGIEPLPEIDPDDPLGTRIIPGTRIVETNAPAVVNALVDTGHYVVCDPPKAPRAKGSGKPDETASVGGSES